MSNYWMIKAHPSFKGFIERYRKQFNERGHNLTYKELTKITFHLTRYSDIRKLPQNKIDWLANKAKNKRGIL